jgi:hypothetical protein
MAWRKTVGASAWRSRMYGGGDLAARPRQEMRAVDGRSAPRRL